MTQLIKTIGDIDFRNVQHWHGEQFLQACRDNGNSPATVAKKVRELKRVFQLAVQRGQLDENPLSKVKQPRIPRKPVHVYSDADCQAIVKNAGVLCQKSSVRWDLMVILALTTGMRRGEILNLIWSDIDFEKQTVEVRPKRNTDKTWEWQVKDADHRTLPLLDGLIALLAQHQGSQPEGYPYVFVPPKRYERIQELRAQGKWSYSDSRNKVLNNFTRKFKLILEKAEAKGEFHDLRRTALSRLMNGNMTKHDIMAIAGHSQFETTERFYLAVKDGLVGRAREAMQTVDTTRLLQICCRDKSAGSHEKGQQT